MRRSSRRLLLFGALTLLAFTGCPAHYHPPAVTGLPRDDPEATLSAVWIGHATVLLRLGDHHVLTDPNLSETLYIVPRDTPASARRQDLPFAHAVLISHMHFDHYDRPTLRSLSDRSVLLYPQGGEPYAGALPQRRQRAMAPWEQVRVGALTITAVPVQHFGGRYGVDSVWNHAYTGYVIDGAGKRVFFAGDTGLGRELFEEIGRRFPAIDLALIPIAPYFRGRGGNRVHADPADAVEIFHAVKARYMIPIHFEGYYAFFAGYDTPRRDLEEVLEAQGLRSRIFPLFPGERWSLPDDPDASPRVSREPRRKVAVPAPLFAN